MSIQVNWLITFSSCYGIHKFLEYNKIPGNYANLISCILFQSYISSKSLFLLLFKEITSSNSSSLLQSLYGYFVYDLSVLIFNDYTKNKKMYIIHHIVSCLLINTLLANNNWSPFYGTLFIFLTESTGPLTNLNMLLKNYPRLKSLNLKLTKYYFLLSRIISLPAVAVKFMNSFKTDSTVHSSVYITFFMLYFMNLNWVIKLFNKVR